MAPAVTTWPHSNPTRLCSNEETLLPLSRRHEVRLKPYDTVVTIDIFLGGIYYGHTSSLIDVNFARVHETDAHDSKKERIQSTSWKFTSREKTRSNKSRNTPIWNIPSSRNWSKRSKDPAPRLKCETVCIQTGRRCTIMRTAQTVSNL